MTTIPITLWQSELQAHRERRLGFLVRLAEKCDYCLGSGLVHPQFAMTPSTCPTCNGTGYTDPLGEAGDVLFHQEEWMVSARDDYDDAVEIEIGLASPDENHWVMFGDDNTPFVPELCTIQPADSMPFWASRPSLRLNRTDDPRFVRLWDAYAEERRAQTQGCAWPMGEYEKRMDAACEWDANNPDAPWSSNPVVVLGGVK